MGIAVINSQQQLWRKEINEYQSVATDPLAKEEALKLASDFIQRVAPKTSSELMLALASFKDARSGIFHKSKDVQGQQLSAVKKLVEDACLRIRQNPPLNYKNYESGEVIHAIYSLIRNEISAFNLLKLGKKKITDGFNCLLFQVQLSATDKAKPYAFIAKHSTLAVVFSKKLINNLKKVHPKPQLVTALALNLSKVVTQNLGAEPLIFEAIYQQKFGLDLRTLNALATGLASFKYTDLSAQYWLSLAIYDQKFGSDPETLKIVASSLKSLKFNSKAQFWLSKAIYEQKFGIAPETLKLVASSLASLNFTDLKIQYLLSKTIYEQKFGSDPETLKIVASSLASLNFTDHNAQLWLSKAIYEQKFGIAPETLKIVASSLASLNFTDPDAQYWLSLAIYEQKFGIAPETLKLVASSLKSLKFNSNTQLWLSKAIYEQKFGIAPETLKLVASSLASLKVTDSNTQFWLSQAIFEQKFGIAPETLKLVASSLASLNFTDHKAQFWLSLAIYEQKFGSNPETLKLVASSLASLKFTDPYTQYWLSQDIFEQKFGNNPEVMPALANFLLHSSFSSVTAQDIIINVVLKARGALGHPLSIIANWVLSETRYSGLQRKILDWTDKNFKQAEIQEFSGMGLRLTKHIQFGEFKNLAQVAERNITVDVENSPISTVANCNDCFSGYGSYGITYNEAGCIQFLIMYRDESQDTLTQITQQFNGFLYSDPEFSVLYQSNFAKLRVYDLTNLQDGYPRLLDLFSTSQKDFSAFPAWLQQAIIAQRFNPDDYVNSSIIKFVLSLVDDLPFAEEVLGQQCKAIVQALIKNQGEAVKLAAEADEDAKIKDLIDIKMAAAAGDSFPSRYDVKTREFVAKLDNWTDKLKLGFLFGQIAKSGALGYHFGQGDSNNRANSLFAHLAIECFKQAIAEHPKELAPDHIIHKVLANIQSGICIEAETNTLAWKVPALFSIWQKKSAL